MKFFYFISRCFEADVFLIQLNFFPTIIKEFLFLMCMSYSDDASSFRNSWVFIQNNLFLFMSKSSSNDWGEKMVVWKRF